MHTRAALRVTNVYRSWDRFYVSLYHDDDHDNDHDVYHDVYLDAYLDNDHDDEAEHERALKQDRGDAPTSDILPPTVYDEASERESTSPGPQRGEEPTSPGPRRGPLFVAAPVSGTLAPRGGANNVCDEARPYLDHVEIGVQARGRGEATMLVRTEEEQWVFRLLAR